MKNASRGIWFKSSSRKEVRGRGGHHNVEKGGKPVPGKTSLQGREKYEKKERRSRKGG